MKILILASFIVISNINYSQSTSKIITNTNHKWMSNTPGQELQKSSKHYYTGLCILNAGATISILGYYFEPEQSDKRFLIYSGFGLSLIGSIFMIESKIHIGRAGIIMDEKGIGLQLKL